MRLRKLVPFAVMYLFSGGPAFSVDPVSNTDGDFVAFTLQDQTLTLSAEELIPPEWLGTVGCCQVVVSDPEVDGSAVAMIEGQIHYDSAPGYFGRDRLEIEVIRGLETRGERIRVFIAPRIVPLAGRWDHVTTTTVRDSPGFYDALTGTFHLCRADRYTINCGDVLLCTPYRPPSVSPGWLPLVGDWQGDGVDRPALLEPLTRTLRLFDFPTGGFCPSCTAAETLLPVANVAVGEPGDVPLAGDWDGNGEDSIGLYRRADNAFHLYDFERDAQDAIIGLVSTGEVVSGFNLAEAGAWPVAIETGGRHRLGLYDPSNGAFEGRDSLAPMAPTSLATFYFGSSSIAVAGDWLEKGDDQRAVYDRNTHYLEAFSRVPAIPPDGAPEPTETYYVEVGASHCYTMVAKFPEDPDDP